MSFTVCSDFYSRLSPSLHDPCLATLKLSPWLAAGCISAPTVFAAVTRYEATRVANNDTYWLVFELLWRDFLRHYTIGALRTRTHYYRCTTADISCESCAQCKNLTRCPSPLHLYSARVAHLPPLGAARCAARVAHRDVEGGHVRARGEG